MVKNYKTLEGTKEAVQSSNRKSLDKINTIYLDKKMPAYMRHFYLYNLFRELSSYFFNTSIYRLVVEL
jgi:hypothetical protein